MCLRSRSRCSSSCFFGAAFAAPKWKDEVGLATWCYDRGVAEEILKEDAKGNTEVAREIWRGAARLGICVYSRQGGMFRPTEQLGEFEIRGKTFVILKGRMVMEDESEGPEAYAMVNRDSLHLFQMDEEAKGPSFIVPVVQERQWHDI